MDIIGGLEGFSPDFQKELIDNIQNEVRFRREVGLKAQADKQRQAGVHFRGIEDLGPPVATIDMASMLYWEGRLGPECWQDPEFLAEYLRDNPESRVAYESKALASSIIVPG